MSSGRLVNDGKTLICSGHDLEQAQGVGIVMSKRAAEVLVGWKPTSDRIITARFQTWLSKITVIQAYAPMKDADNVNIFYNQLQETLDDTPAMTWSF